MKQSYKNHPNYDKAYEHGVRYRKAFEKGISYGITSGVTTTLGLIIGLYFSSASKEVILTGIFTIAFADAFSDGFGSQVSEEAENKRGKGLILITTISTIITKMLFALTFAVPIVMMSLDIALLVAVAWGILLLAALSVFIAVQNKKKVMRFLFQHIGTGSIVIIGSYFVGKAIETFFK